MEIFFAYLFGAIIAGMGASLAWLEKEIGLETYYRIKFKNNLIEAKICQNMAKTLITAGLIVIFIAISR